MVQHRWLQRVCLFAGAGFHNGNATEDDARVFGGLENEGGSCSGAFHRASAAVAGRTHGESRVLQIYIAHFPEQAV
jgi:hypothetical protein